MRLKFTKLHGLGNDFILIDHRCQSGSFQLDTPTLKKFSDRRRGIGCDQVIELYENEKGLSVAFWNADGSSAQMCGNGMRAVGLYFFQETKRSIIEVMTAVGKKVIQVQDEDHIEVGLGQPKLGSPESLQLEGEIVTFQAVDVGNPHAVIFVEHLDWDQLSRLGPRIENHPRFKDRTNVELVQVDGPRKITVGVWERGAGITQACGTGAVAATASTIALNGGKSPMKVQLLGGVLSVSWAGPGSEASLLGPARVVFHGEVDLGPMDEV